MASFFKHKSGNIKWKALLPNSFCWTPAVGRNSEQLQSFRESKISLAEKQRGERLQEVPRAQRKFQPLQIVSNPSKQSALRSPARPPPLVSKLQHLQCIVAAFRLETPLSPTPNSIESKEAIKIPSCRKKPLSRVDARRRLAKMKRSRSSTLRQSHCWGSHNNRPTGQEPLLLLVFLAFAATELGWEEPGLAAVSSGPGGFKDVLL